MIAYRSEEEPIDGRAAWRELRCRIDGLPPRPTHDAATSLLIDAGELESAIADAVFASEDGSGALTDAVRAVTVAAGRLFVETWCERDVARRVEGLRAAVRGVREDALPRSISRRVSEGYAFYALHPETYVVAARHFVTALAPAAAVCIGIRSIGTSLSAVVAATLEREGVGVQSLTVRPRGHPFDRQLRLTSALVSAVCGTPGAHYLVVDEGPGLSGSSFAAVATALASSGVPPERIALFPSWDADGSTFRNGEARKVWRSHTRWVADATDAGAGIERAAPIAGAVDWSGGQWRQHLLQDQSSWPAVNAQHERVKRYVPEQSMVVRFAGLGRYGLARVARAEALAEQGFAAPAGELSGGYLRLRFVEGRPMNGAVVSGPIVKAVARYVAFVARRFPATRSPSIEAVHEMIRVNAAEADPALIVPPLTAFGAALGDAPAAAGDGRMLPHEFIATPRGLVKVDALDHSSDHFFPGRQDPAWDLAAFEAEFDLHESAGSALVGEYARAAGDAEVSERMRFYRLAYAAYQVGYSTLSAESCGEGERQRFDSRRERFTARLRRLLAA